MQKGAISAPLLVVILFIVVVGALFVSSQFGLLRPGQITPPPTNQQECISQGGTWDAVNSLCILQQVSTCPDNGQTTYTFTVRNPEDTTTSDTYDTNGLLYAGGVI